MGEAILLNRSTKNKSDYNWKYAFNNDEFIKFLVEHGYTPSYMGYEEEIDPYAYSGVTKFESVRFPNMWKNIGSHAFENCTNLVSASFYGGSYNNSNYKIDDYAFAGCYSLQYFSMVVPKNIGKRAFYGCSNLQYAYFFSAMRGSPSESYWMCDIDDEAFLDCKCTGFSLYYLGYVKRIGKRAFENCTFTSYYSSLVGYSICRRVDDEAFLNCSTMKMIQLNCYPLSYSSSYITCELGKDIFKGCNNLYSITIGCLPSISSTAFGDTIKSTLKHIKIGISYYLASWYFDGYTNIGSHAFDGYSILSSVEISHIKSIGEYAFANCPSIQSIELHYSSPCSSIGAYAFYNCTSLSSFVIRSAVTYIGSHAFENCSLLQGFYSYSVSNIEYIGEYAFYNCYNLGTGYYGSDAIAFNNAIYICSHAFENCSTLTAIKNIGTNANMGSGCSAISDYAFANCSNISQALLGVQMIGPHAFENCTLLSSVYGPNCTHYIGSYAFANCDLRMFTMGLSLLNYIGEYAFSGCSNLSLIVLDAVLSIPILESINAFDNILPNYKIIVSSALYQNFINDSVWGLISDNISTTI